MDISTRWLRVAVLTFLVGFGVLIYLAIVVDREQPPIPERVIAPDGSLLFTGQDVLAGQHIFMQRGLMEYGTIFGHGAYLGPDFTTQYLHRAIQLMQAGHADGDSAVAAALLAREWKTNRYEAGSRTLTFTAGQADALAGMIRFYGDWFGQPPSQQGLRRPYIDDPEQVRRLTAFFAWSAWVSAARRPGLDYSYTNNWPPDEAVGNVPTAAAYVWSALSLIALLGGAGLVFYGFGKYDLLGWHHVAITSDQSLSFRAPAEVKLTPSQRAVPWYFLVIAGLFLVQGLLGGANAHYHVEPQGFWGYDLARLFPYNLTRMWHLQLALFFVAASFLAMGIFLVPMIARREPRHQDRLAIALFGALVVVVIGSLLGELAGMRDSLPAWADWFWLGPQGWEYLDLGRLWQLALVVGMGLWLVIIIRGLLPRLAGEHPGNLPWLFFYSAVSIPLFYAVGLVIGRSTSYVLTDFWRFWVVHLWVEDFLELFTTIMVAYLFVLLKVVQPKVATRIVYLDIILYSVGGVIGTMHHLYFSGAPSLHLGLGAFFSAMEVIPLLLLSFEAWRFMQLGTRSGRGSAMHTSSREFPHKWAVMFLVAVGFWNFLGAGVFGFLINLPVVSYYEIGTSFTANHGHGALMGVYGMLALGFFMFVARYFIPIDRGSERAMGISFWSLNLGLGGMILLNLAPIGVLQLHAAVSRGYWFARSAEFHAQPAVRVLEWLRLPADLFFILGGILPVLYLAWRMWRNRQRPGTVELGEESEPLTGISPAAGTAE
jgi:nitric oxide reductase subunit B